MEDSRFKRTYAVINIIFVVIISILFFTPFFISNELTNLYYVGVFTRIIFGIYLIFTGIWNGFTNYYSFLKFNSTDKDNATPLWAYIGIIVIGAIFLVTAFMGYGFNKIN